MTELLTAQEAGREPEDQLKLRLSAGRLDRQLSTTSFPGHAAWIEGDLKLHRIANHQGEAVRFELYNLKDDPRETNDLLSQQQARAGEMQAELEAWLLSVVRSHNGADY